VKFQLVGAEELNRGLILLSDVYEAQARRVLKFGVRKGGRVIAEEMKVRLDSVTRGGTGKTRDSIGVFAAPKGDLEGDETAVAVGASKKRGFIARFLEDGTSKMRARVHATPAFESKQGEALNVIVSESTKALARAVKKIKKAPR